MKNFAVYSFSLISLIILTWAAWQNNDSSSAIRFALGFGLTIVFMLLISPLGWIYDFPLLILPATLILWKYAVWKQQFLKLTVVAIWILLTILLFLPRNQVDGFYILLYIGFYAYVLLVFGVLLVCLIFNRYQDWKLFI